MNFGHPAVTLPTGAYASIGRACVTNKSGAATMLGIARITAATGNTSVSCDLLPMGVTVFSGVLAIGVETTSVTSVPQ